MKKNWSRLSITTTGEKSKNRHSLVEKSKSEGSSPESRRSSSLLLEDKSTIESASLKSGYLWKKGGESVGEVDTKSTGSISLAGYDIELFDETRKPYAFQLKDPSQSLRRVYFLSAASKEDQANWMEVLHQVINGTVLQDKNAAKIESKLKLNEYKISEEELAWSDEILGKGGSGIIRKATWLGCTTVAVKTLNNLPEFIDAKELSGFYKEIEMLSTLRHPNIVSMYGYCRKGSYTCLVTEYIKGGNLQDVILNVDKYQYNPLEVALCVCRGMLYLHSKNIIHRDLKPGNILVESIEHSRVKICDFGLSKVTKMNATAQQSVFTAMGTPSYAAPELMSGKHTDKVDVFSYGMILWAIYTRQQLWPHLTHPWKITEKITSGERPTIPTSCPLNILIGKCWHQDPEIRPTFKQIYEELLIYQQKVSTGIQAESKSTPKKEEKLEIELIKGFLDKPQLEWKDFENVLLSLFGEPHDVVRSLKPLFCNPKDELVYKTEVEYLLLWFSPLISHQKNINQENQDKMFIYQNFHSLFQDGYTLKDISRIVSPSWFYGLVTNSQLQELFEEASEGSFLFRFSTSNPGSYALSVKQSHGISHFLIQSKKNPHQTFTINDKQYTSLDHIIEKHSKEPFSIVDSKGGVALQVCLGSPLDKKIHTTIK